MTGHLRLYWIRTSCKSYNYERIVYGKIIIISMKPDIETIFMNASKTMMENLGCMRKSAL